MNKNKGLISIILLFLILQGCKVNKKNNINSYDVYKQKQLVTILKSAAKMHTAKFLSVLKQIKDTARNSKSRNKIEKIESLQEYLLSMDNSIYEMLSKINKNATISNINSLMLKDQTSYASVLARKFDRNHHKYKKINSRYLLDTTSWSRRYIKLLSGGKANNPPSFGEFYFGGANKEETVITLNMLWLAILQEALEIQQKIINEK